MCLVPCLAHGRSMIGVSYSSLLGLVKVGLDSTGKSVEQLSLPGTVVGILHVFSIPILIIIPWNRDYQ